MRIIIVIFFIASLIFSSCKEAPKLEGFNSELWKEDKKGCKGKRTYLSEILLTKTSDLRGVDDDDIVEILGKPDKYEGETRGKKTYYYYTQPGSQCESNLMLEGAQIVIEFNAIGKVNIITEKKF
jgi:hypothetical protein